VSKKRTDKNDERLCERSECDREALQQRRYRTFEEQNNHTNHREDEHDHQSHEEQSSSH
jgi:hypothetical protein